jgi:integrase
MPLSLFKADKTRHKYGIRGPLSDGKFIKIPAHRDRKVAEHMLRMVESLDRSRALNQSPDPQVVQWLDGQPPKYVERLVALGLVEQRVLGKRRPLDSLLDEFQKFCESDNDDASIAPIVKIKMVRRILTALGSQIKISDITKESVNEALKTFVAESGKRRGLSISQKTRREYVFAIKAFVGWLVDEKGLAMNPLRKLKAPSANGDPVRKRRPIPLLEFKRLGDYLMTAPARYSHQLFDWTPEDRLMIYWTAAMTGFRMNELRSLTRAHIQFDPIVTRVSVDGWVAKNGEQASIPIPDQFAQALDQYSAHLHPNAPLLRMPSDSQMLNALYRDLDASGVRRTFDDGAAVDFHTLRSTAICWWLTVNKLHILDVQKMARLKTLALVQQYVDDYVPDFTNLIANAPRLFDQRLPEEERKGKGD